MLSKGLLIKQISDDGNCLFGAIADQIYTDPGLHAELRKQCLDYMVTTSSSSSTREPALHCIYSGAEDHSHTLSSSSNRAGEGSGPLLAVCDGGL
jgi:hypothetical protein